MKEIKFRAWDKKNKVMGYISRWIFPNDHGIGLIALKDQPIIHETHYGYGELEIMQYTGLKDKNGKEIYEGDIVELRDNGIGTGYEYPVCWDGEDLTFKVGYAMLGGQDVEVIGNIYEGTT